MEFVNHELKFCVDGFKALPELADPDHSDFFSGFDFYEEVSRDVWSSSSHVTTRHSIAVYRALLNFARQVLRTEKPYMLLFSANEQRKMPIYRQVGLKLAKQHGYFLNESGSRFTLYRLVSEDGRTVK
jgi:hypothetical protein